LEQLQKIPVFFGAVPTGVFFGAVPTVWYFLELFQQCGIFWSCSNSVVFPKYTTTPKNNKLLEQLQKYHTVGTAPKNTPVGTAPKNTTLLEQLLFQQCGIFWSCFNSVAFFVAVPIVWYFLELFQ
jgi:hypothetical protein